MPAFASDPDEAALLPWRGEAKPDIELDSLDQGRISLEDHRGGAVLVHFFATWCEPCREELQSLDRLAARHRDGLTVLAIDVGEVDARVRSFFRKHPVGYPVLIDRDRSTTKAWEVMSLPTTFVLDAELSPVLVAERAIEWGRREIDATLGLAIDAGPGPDQQSVGQRSEGE